MSQELGTAGITKIVGGDFYTVKFKRNARVNALSVMDAGIRIEVDIILINPLFIFQRMCIAENLISNLRSSLSRFNDDGMHIKSMCIKSSLYKAF